MATILALVDELYEDLELWYPKYRLEEAGHKVILAAPEAQKLYKGKHGYPCMSEEAFFQIKQEDFDGILIPGGFAPDKLRRIHKVLELVKHADELGKMIAFICHAGWVPISAKIVKDRKMTSFFAIRDDLENAGALWQNNPVVIDKNLITSRTPLDLPLFGKAIVEYLKDKS